MRTTSKLLALALTATMQSAMAGAVFLDFEDVQLTEQLTNRYAAQNVSVTGAAWTATSVACKYGGVPGDVRFSRTGSCGALWLAADPTDSATGQTSSFTMTLADGFIDAVSFIYAGSISSLNLAVHVFDANGDELGLGLSGLTGPASCSGFIYCNWSTQPVTLNFTGTARSVVFSARDQAVLIDDIRFKTPGIGRLPEPTSVALALGALAGLGWTRRRAAR